MSSGKLYSTPFHSLSAVVPDPLLVSPLPSLNDVMNLHNYDRIWYKEVYFASFLINSKTGLLWYCKNAAYWEENLEVQTILCWRFSILSFCLQQVLISKQVLHSSLSESLQKGRGERPLSKRAVTKINHYRKYNL